MLNLEFFRIYNNLQNKKKSSEIWNLIKNFRDGYRNNVLHYLVLSEDLVLLDQLVKSLDSILLDLLLNSRNVLNETPIDWIMNINDHKIRNKALSILKLPISPSKKIPEGKNLLIEEIRKFLIGDENLYNLSQDVSINISLKGLNLEPRIKFNYLYLYGYYGNKTFSKEDIDKDQNCNISTAEFEKKKYVINLIYDLLKSALVHKLYCPAGRRKERYKYLLEKFYSVDESKIRQPNLIPIRAVFKWINIDINDSEFYYLIFLLIKTYLNVVKQMNITTPIPLNHQGSSKSLSRLKNLLDSFENFVTLIFKRYSIAYDEFFALLIELLRERKLYSKHDCLSYELTGLVNHLITDEVKDKEFIRLIYPQLNLDFLPYLFSLTKLKIKIHLYVNKDRIKTYPIDILEHFLNHYGIEIKSITELNSNKNDELKNRYNVFLLSLPSISNNEVEIMDEAKKPKNKSLEEEYTYYINITDFLKKYPKNTVIFTILHRMSQSESTENSIKEAVNEIQKITMKNCFYPFMIRSEVREVYLIEKFIKIKDKSSTGLNHWVGIAKIRMMENCPNKVKTVKNNINYDFKLLSILEAIRNGIANILVETGRATCN